MTLDEVIEKYTNNAEYERQNGNLQGCLDFRQLAEWLKDYKRLLEQEPCRVKNELNVELNELKPCDDAISREMALKECHDIVVDGERYRVIQEETLLGLPPVTPSCDKCAMNGSGSKYCDNCGQMSRKCELKALIDKHRMYRLAYDELSEFERDVLELAESEEQTE